MSRLGASARGILASLAIGLAVALAPAAVDAQRLPSLPPDTVRPAAADTLPPDSAAPALSPRDRVLERLRALPNSPIQRDLAAEQAAEGDTEPESAGEAEDAQEVERDAEPDAEPGEARDAEAAPDTAAVSGARSWFATPDVPHEEDRIRSLLRGLEGYVATEYRGDAAVFEGEGNRLRLQGDSRVAREGSAMETDSVMVYRGDTGIVCGFGNPVLSGDANPIESDQVCYDIHRRVGMADGARTEFTQGGNWFVRGPQNRVFVLNGEGSNRIYGERAEFTSCDLDHPHSAFHARSLKMVENDVLVARNVTLRFGDVPVFWLPWMVQSLKPDRRSGFLTPQFGVNDIVRNQDRVRYARRISNLGFYWAANDYVSMLVAGEWFSGNYVAAEGSVTYAWARQFLQGRLAVKRFWHHADFGTGRRDLTISTSNSWRPDERTQMQVSGDYTTSTSTVRDFSFDPRELNRQIASSASVNRSFGWGSASLGANRRQQITDDQVNWTLPSLSLNLRPLTLFSSDDGSRSLTWSGSGTVNRTLRQVNHDLTPRVQGNETLNASASHNLAFGRLSLNQGFQFRDHTDHARPFQLLPDAPMGSRIVTALDATSQQDLTWNSGLSFQHTLWPGTTLSPSVSVQGQQVRDDRTDGAYVAAPNRISAGASMGTTIFGFWPGFGQYERIRHKISPSLSWTYSPAPRTTELQDSIFSLSPASLRERNSIGLSFNQTFEAKVRENGDNGEGAAARSANDVAAGERDGADDDAAEDQVADGTDESIDDPSLDDGGEPRRLPQSRTINLLSINTGTNFVYDFVEARERGRGFLTEEISNSIRSDLVPGLQLNMSHSLFERGERPADGSLTPRTFKPHLTRLSTSFSIDSGFWLFRMLGMGARDATPRPADADTLENGDAVDLDHRDPGRGSIVPRPGGMSMGRGAGSGWRANLSYSFNRPTRVLDGPSPIAQQTVNGSLNFSPTEHWTVNWSTTYSFTTGDFDAHVLTLTRDLHEWQANFDFIKSPNGNFAMQFRVHLLNNPDLKVEYDQRTNPAERLDMRQP